MSIEALKIQIAAQPSKVTLIAANREQGRRYVFGDHSNTAHVWAQNEIIEGRSSDDRMSFANGTLYSYGTHFALGTVVETTEGRVYLLNSNGYSSSTGKHKSHARHAVHGRTLSVPDLTSITMALHRLSHDATKEVADRFKAQIDAFTIKHILMLNPETAVFFAAITGKTRSVLKWYRDAEKAQAKAAALGKKNATESLIRHARNAATISDGELAEHVARQLGNPLWLKDRREDVADVMKRIALEYHRYKRNGKTLPKKLQAVLAARHKKLKEDAAHYVERAARRQALQAFRNNKLALRAVIAKAHGTDLAGLEKHNLQRAISALRDMDGIRFIQGELRKKLVQIGREFASELDIRIREENRARMEKERTQRERWLAGSTDSDLRYLRLADEMGNALVRVRGDNLETSQGATVPLKDAIKVFRFVKLCHDTGKSWKRNGATLRVGHFQVDLIEPNGDFTAGCHKFSWNECARLAGELDLLNIEPADTTAHA